VVDWRVLFKFPIDIEEFITIWPAKDDFESLAVGINRTKTLAIIYKIARKDVPTVEIAFYQSLSSGVGAFIARFNRWTALEVEVDWRQQQSATMFLWLHHYINLQELQPASLLHCSAQSAGLYRSSWKRVIYCVDLMEASELLAMASKPAGLATSLEMVLNRGQEVKSAGVFVVLGLEPGLGPWKTRLPIGAQASNLLLGRTMAEAVPRMAEAAARGATTRKKQFIVNCVWVRVFDWDE
jgi:hypothetical protein